MTNNDPLPEKPAHPAPEKIQDVRPEEPEHQTEQALKRIALEVYVVASEGLVRYGMWILLFSTVLIIFSLAELGARVQYFGKNTIIYVPRKATTVLILLCIELGYIGLFTVALARTEFRDLLRKFYKLAEEHVNENYSKLFGRLLIIVTAIGLIFVCLLAAAALMCGTVYLAKALIAHVL